MTEFKVKDRVSKKGFDCKGTVINGFQGHKNLEIVWDGSHNSTIETLEHLTLLEGIDSLTKGDKFRLTGEQVSEVYQVSGENVYYHNEHEISLFRSFKELKADGATLITTPKEVIVTAENWKEYRDKECVFWNDKPSKSQVAILVYYDKNDADCPFMYQFIKEGISWSSNCKYIQEEGEA